MRTLFDETILHGYLLHTVVLYFLFKYGFT